MPLIEHLGLEPVPAPRKTKRDRMHERREEKLDLVRQQLASGSLVIRQMTPEERLRYPPVSADPASPASRGSRAGRSATSVAKH